RSAAFLAGILGLSAPTRFAHFLVVEADNNVSLDVAEATGKITPQHYAFLVGEDEFDAAFGRIRDQDLRCWADPGQTPAGGDQPPGRRPRTVLRRPGRPPAGDHHPALRQRRLTLPAADAAPQNPLPTAGQPLRGMSVYPIKQSAGGRRIDAG